MDQKQKKILAVGVIILVVIVLFFLLFISQKKTSEQTTSEAVPTEVLIPTIDSSVIVELEALSAKREVMLAVKNSPLGTESIDYELSYQTQQQGLQGIIGTLDTKRAGGNFEKRLTLGTCSSGTCTYHQVVGKVRLTLKFSGSYGEKIFEKEFEI